MTESTAEAPSRRGRPRDPQAEARDIDVLRVISKGARTSIEIAEQVNTDKGKAYLSVYRLVRNRDEQGNAVPLVEKDTSEGAPRNAWRVTEAGEKRLANG